MPVIHIQALPQQAPLDTGDVLSQLSRQLAANCGIDLQHVSATWRELSSGCYVDAGKPATVQPDSSHPILVDVSIPEIYPDAKIDCMMQTLAHVLKRQLGIPLDNIFIAVHTVQAGQVFDGGEVQHFK